MTLFEILPIEVDIKQLRDHLLEVVFPVGKPILQGTEYGFEVFGGWSLQSRTGHWADGWEMSRAGQQYEQHEWADLKQRNVSHPFEQHVQTQICTGYVKQLIDKIDEMGFYPRRARITLSKPRTTSIVHRDNLDNEYGARIHIPIISNQHVLHETQYGNFHMEPGNVYIIWVNNLHRIANYSPYDRYHIIMDAYDTKHVTNNFKYTGNINDLIQQAKQYRQNIDNI